MPVLLSLVSLTPIDSLSLFRMVNHGVLYSIIGESWCGVLAPPVRRVGRKTYRLVFLGLCGRCRNNSKH
jgi:hypothetical protein